MGSYYIWTIGCQMNVADSEQLGHQLENMGYHAVMSPEGADVVVLNSCVVRQHAEDKVSGKLFNLRSLKKSRPDTIVGLMGCMVGPKTDDLRRRFPHVDVFMRPQVFDPVLELAKARAEALRSGSRQASTEACYEPQPTTTAALSHTAFIPIIHGCDHFCTFCIVPYRRGRERSRLISDIRDEVETLVGRGVREVTLLGQKVDSYGQDLVDRPDLADLFHALHDVDGLDRIRFLTSFPMGITDKIIASVRDLDKVCEHFNIPIQSGDDDVLLAMRRGYTVEGYLDVVGKIRAAVPGVGLSTDIIVGFPGETDRQFDNTYKLLEDVQFDVVHVAAYSERQGTIASRTQPDDVPLAVKKERLRAVEELQKDISEKINAELVGQKLVILVEDRKKDKWEGRTRTGKLVYFPAGATDLKGSLATIYIESASPWSLQGSLIAID